MAAIPCTASRCWSASAGDGAKRRGAVVPRVHLSRLAASASKRAVRHDRGVDNLLSPLRTPCDRTDAGGCLPDRLRLQRLRGAAATQGGRLLHILLLWVGTVPASSGCP